MIEADIAVSGLLQFIGCSQHLFEPVGGTGQQRFVNRLLVFTEPGHMRIAENGYPRGTGRGNGPCRRPDMCLGLSGQSIYHIH